MLFQFIAYPILCRTIGIIRLLYICGVAMMVLFLVIPDFQRLPWSTRHSYLVGVSLRVLFESASSAVSFVWIDLDAARLESIALPCCPSFVTVGPLGLVPTHRDINRS